MRRRRRRRKVTQRRRPQLIPGSRCQWWMLPQLQLWPRYRGPPGPMASPDLLLRAVLPLLPCPLWVQHFPQVSLLRLQCPTPRVPGRCFKRSSIFFQAPNWSCVIWQRLDQGACSFPGPWWLIPKSGPGGREPLARFQLRNPECGRPRRLCPPRRAPLWSFSLPVEGLPPCLRHVIFLLRHFLRAILRPPQPRPLPPLRSSPPSPPFGPRSLRAWGGSDPERRTLGAQGARSPDKTLPQIRLPMRQ